MEVSTVSHLCVHVCTVFNPDLQVSVLSVLPLTCVGLRINAASMGIYGISSICQLSQQVHPISQIHSCESKGELWLNNVVFLIQLFSED